MAVTLTIADNRSQFSFGNKYAVIGKFTFPSGNYATGGVTLDLRNSEVKASRPPLAIFFMSTLGYEYAYINGTDLSNGLLEIFVSGGTEFTNGNPLPADTVTFFAIFQGME